MKGPAPCLFHPLTMLHRALRHLRKYHKLSQQDLARQLGISNTYLSEIESGVKAHAITVDLLSKYSEVFDVPVSSILLFSEQIDYSKRSDKMRIAMASKILKILDWIDAHAEHPA